MKVIYLGVGKETYSRFRMDFEIEYGSEQEFEEIKRCIKEQLVRK